MLNPSEVPCVRVQWPPQAGFSHCEPVIHKVFKAQWMTTSLFLRRSMYPLRLSESQMTLAHQVVAEYSTFCCEWRWEMAVGTDPHVWVFYRPCAPASHPVTSLPTHQERVVVVLHFRCEPNVCADAVEVFLGTSLVHPRQRTGPWRYRQYIYTSEKD
jgi:hypothetical protein